ncbi:glycoside hydrolase family 16 protein [Streptomyces sp. 8N114]|uniref:glycoside hydrolase family 16 protein n=1 Tax=Streptomyces sp. 8N114 TaxID=3457419 RepID=UPI003FD3F85D
MKRNLGLKTGTALAAAFACIWMVAGPAPAEETPSEDACKTTDNTMPSGDCGKFRQVFAENFSGDTVPVGSFSDCDHNVDTADAYCGGLSGEYRKNWWAYPTGWYDTAHPNNHSNGNDRKMGGEYRADKTVSVSPSGYDGTGTMKVDMYRPQTGDDNYVGTVVPRKCMDRAYGKYTERFKVTRMDPGFKAAHLFYEDPHEMDFPEAGGNFNDDKISAFTHPSEENVDTGASWTTPHTTSIEWTPGKVKYFLDGKLVKTATRDISSSPMDWALQNESALSGAYADRGAHAAIETTWVTCYSYKS